MTTIDDDYFRLDRVQRHGAASIERMLDKIENTTGECRDRALARLRRFEATLATEVFNIRRKIRRKESRNESNTR